MREKEERHSGEQQTEAGTLPQKYAERAAMRRRCGMAGEQLPAQPEDGAREQRVGNALQRGDGKPPAMGMTRTPKRVTQTPSSMESTIYAADPMLRAMP